VIDFHGDQQLPGEICYPLNMESPHGINPLMVDLDTRAGTGTTNNCCRCRDEAGHDGTNQEGLLISVLENCYSSKGITQADAKPGLRHRLLLDVRKEVESRIEDGCKTVKLALKLAATFQYGIFDRPQPPNQLRLFALICQPWEGSRIGSIKAESLTKHLMDSSPTDGSQWQGSQNYLFIDEAKEIKASCLSI